MLIIALVLAVIGLAALVTAVVTSNELIAWVCIGASVIGVLLLIVDAVRERSRRGSEGDAESETTAGYEPNYAESQPEFDADYPEDATVNERPDDTTVIDQPVTEDSDTARVEDSDEVPNGERNR